MEPESEDLLTYVIETVPSWSEDLVVECGKVLVIAIEEGLIMSLFQSDILQIAFQFIGPAVDPVVEAWTPVVCRLMPQLPITTVMEECVPMIMKISDYSQAVALRKAGTVLLSSLAEILGSKFSPELLHRCFRLAQDTNYRIRAATCVTLTTLGRTLSSDLLLSKLFPEVKALVEDENEEVQREALELLSKLLCLFPQDFIENHVLDLILQTVLPVKDFPVRAKLSECFGELCVGLKETLTSDTRSQLLGLFTEFANHPSALIRKNAAFNFPAVLSILISQPHITYFRVIYTKLCKDEKLEVRIPALSAFPEVAKILSDQNDMFVSLLSELLDDPMVQWVLITVLPQCPPGILTENVLKRTANLMLSAKAWRKQLKVIEICRLLLDKVNSRVLMSVFSPSLFTLVTSGPWLLRAECGLFLADMIKSSHYGDVKSSLCAFITESLGQSKRFEDRLVFLNTCLRVISNNSKRFLKRNFLDTILDLGKDPVKNVKVLFSQHLITFRKAIGNDHSDTVSRFAAVVNSMLSDPCLLIAQNAQNAQATIMTQGFWKEITSLKEINAEAQKVNFENRQNEEEKQEQEEARRKLVEELTAKARSDFQLVKTQTRSRHSRKPTSIQISLSPVAKKVANTQESSRSHYYKGPPRSYVLRTYRKNK